MDPIILDYQSPKQRSIDHPVITPFETAFHVIIGILLPLICFLLSLPKYPAGPDYQSGEWHAYVGLIPSGLCALPFYPFLWWAVYSLVRMVSDPGEASNSVIVRVGLFGGVLLALQFSLIQAISLSKPVEIISRETAMDVVITLAAPVIIIVVGIAIRALTYALGGFSVFAASFILGCLGLLIGLVFLRAGALVIVPLALLFGAPFLTLGSFVALSITAVRLSQDRFSRALMWVWSMVWLGGYIVAWDLSVRAALVEYTKLPKTNPSCYIATAAARGHRSIVRSRRSADAKGFSFPINDQLRHFKCAEIALRQLCPNSHRFMRRIYDCIGPMLARRVTHPILADIAYLSLKPLEWTARFAMRFILPGSLSMARQLYST